MNDFRLALRTSALFGVTFLFVSVVSAQVTRTWVSGVGDDANPCSRVAPCKTFAGAISKTAPGGEIDCLDPGGFGAVTITKSITIDCGAGQVGSILAAGTNGINVSAPTTDIVRIRNLSIQGITTGSTGILGLTPATRQAFGFNPPMPARNCSLRTPSWTTMAFRQQLAVGLS